MQERKGIIARTKLLSRQQGMGLKIHEKELPLDWNTETPPTIKEEVESSAQEGNCMGMGMSRLIHFYENNHKRSSPCSFFPGENQKQGHQQISLALFKGNQLQCCKVSCGEIHMTKNWRRPPATVGEDLRPSVQWPMRNLETQEESLETDPPRAEPWDNCSPSWHLHCKLVKDLEADAPS